MRGSIARWLKSLCLVDRQGFTVCFPPWTPPSFIDLLTQHCHQDARSLIQYSVPCCLRFILSHRAPVSLLMALLLELLSFSFSSHADFHQPSSSSMSLPNRSFGHYLHDLRSHVSSLSAYEVESGLSTDMDRLISHQGSQDCLSYNKEF